MATSLRIRRPKLAHDLRRDVRLTRHAGSRLAILASAAAVASVPFLASDFWLSVLVLGGIAAIAGLGLTLLAGQARQVSLAHAFFLAIGAYTAAELGVDQELPIYVWLPAAALAAGVVGAVAGRVVLRLRGQYLAIGSAALVFVGLWTWERWDGVTGGPKGVTGAPPVEIGPLDVDRPVIAGETFSREQVWFWLVWVLVGVAALAAANARRGRPGRVLLAAAHDETAALVAGARPSSLRAGAFTTSSVFAGVAGALTFAFTQTATPSQWGLPLSVRFLAVVVVGGVGTVHGAVLGGILIGGLPDVIGRLDREVALLDDLDLSVAEATNLVVAVLLVVAALLWPRGLAAVATGVGRYVRSWPFGDRRPVRRPT